MTSESLFCPHCGAEYTPAEKQCTFCQHVFAEELDLFDPSDLFHERYQILNQIGTGGFGAVYQARDTQAQQRLVAIKQINLQGLTAQEIIEATDGFNRERQFLSSLTHDHLPRIYDHFMDAEHWYLIMEFIAGQTLETYLQSLTSPSVSLVRALSVDEIVDIGLQLCDVLSYLHGQFQPIIFRDLKPSNVMRTDQGAIYLIDFGIARYFKPGKLKDTIPFGSPGYAAPEQYGKGQTTAQADIYSLGALLYYMLSGLDPAENPFHFAPLRLYGTAGLAELEALIMQMVALDIQQRPSDIQVVSIKLQHIRRLRGSSKSSISYFPTAQHPSSVGQSGGSKGSSKRPGLSGSPKGPARRSGRSARKSSTRQSGQQQLQMSQVPARSQKAGILGLSRRTLIKRGWQIGLAVGVGSVILYNVIPSLHQSQALWPNMTLVFDTPMTNVSTTITSVVHSSLKKLFAIADQAGNVTVLSMTTYNMVYQWHVPQPVTSLSWTSDAQYLSAAAGRSVYTWKIPDVVDATSVWPKDPWIVHDDILPAMVQTVSWNPFEQMILAVGDVDGNVRVFQVSSEGALNFPLYNSGANLGRSPQVTPSSVVVYWAGGMLYSLLDRDSVNAWNLYFPEDNARIITFAGLSNDVQEVLPLPYNLVVLDVTGQISLFNEDYQKVQSLANAGDSSIINALAYSDDGLIFGVTDAGIYIWSVNSPGSKPKFLASQGVMQSVDYVEDEDVTLVITGGMNGALQIWKVE